MKLFVQAGLAALAAAALSACSIMDIASDNKIDYKSATKSASLEVPPDLTQLSRDSRYVVPGSTVSASTYQIGQAIPGVPTAATAVGDVRIERAGSQRWIVVNRAPDQIWDAVKAFWTDNGFVLTTDQPNLGILETDWAENRAKIPQDAVRSTLGKVFENLYSTSERDRFRTRLERSPAGGTEIYISHRGMQEVYTTQSKDQTVWQPRPADPELESEFLRRLMVRLGAPQQVAAASTAAPKPAARISSVNNQPVVVVDEGFDRAWRRVGLALDRTGFTVEDRDRTQGTYFVRYVTPAADKKDGFLSKLFRRENAEPPLKFRIALKSEGQSTTVSVLNSQGAPETGANAERIVKVIADDLQ